MDAQNAKKILQKQYNRQNEFIKNNYDRISVTMPKGTKERITATGESVNGFINRVVLLELERIEKEQNKTTE